MPTPTLAEGQYSLDGYTFGTLADEIVLLESGVDWGQVGSRTQDVEEPLGDGVMFGRDFLTPPTWTFSMGARHATDVATVVGRVAAAWRADTTRLTPGARSELFYRRGGVTRLAYGRPRRFAVETPRVWQPDFRVVTADFQLAEPVVYIAAESSLTLSLVRTSTAAGLVFPTVFPVTFGSPPSTRTGTVTVDGTVRVPFTVRVNGPVTGSASSFRVESVTGTDPWVLDLPGTLTPGQWLEVDTGTGVVRFNGQAAQVALGRLTDLTARLAPGPQELAFTAADPSQTATVIVTWRAAAAAAV